MKKYGKYEGLLKMALLLVGVPLMIYCLGIAKTVELKKELNNIEKQIAGAESIPAGERKTASLAKRTAGAHHPSDDIRTGALLAAITPILRQYGTTAVNYTPYLLRQEGDMELYAAEIVLAGKFIPLTRTLRDIEELSGDYHIVSVAYKTETEPRSRKKQLKLTIIFQQITIKQTI